MSSKQLVTKNITVLVLVSILLSAVMAPLPGGTQTAMAASASVPLVAIHVSELTQALEAMPAAPPTPTGSGYSGYEWFYTSWHYFVIYESLKIALESDGTPYVIVTDADIAGGALLEGRAPKYPIVFSLASEAIADNEIQPLRDYVNAGGFLFVGSSAFTRNPNGTTRGDFALASEMGLSMANSSLLNWTLNSTFERWADHRLVSHIPAGSLRWDMVTNAEDVTCCEVGPQQLWQVVANGVEVIATGEDLPLLATKDYGAGRFIYHAIFNPILGAGGFDSGMYAYTIYRNAIEWAFEAANLPMVKRSPWPYDYDAAFIVRHDFENYLSHIGIIDASAFYEQSIGVKGEYNFCTGAVRTLDPQEKQPIIDGLRQAVSDYGATIGSHNGGYPNIGVTDPSEYEYWHWGPDTMLDQTSGFPPPYDYYTSGYDYSKDSIQLSFQDIEGWLAGLDNGRAGCGALGNCPRTWVSPAFNSGRDRSFEILEELGSITMGEQKLGPFPHWTLSYDAANTDHRYNHLAISTSEWYVGTIVSQSIEGHNTASVQALVDFYHQKGYMINLYGHGSSLEGNIRTYIDYAVAKPRMWATNSVGLYDWWLKRDPVVATPSYSRSGAMAIVTAVVSGATDPQSAIELVIPNWSSGVVGNLEVLLNGAPADPGEYRTTSYGVKVRVGTAVTNVEIRYQPLETWAQTDWSGGPGQALWGDATRYDNATGVDHSVAGQVSLALAAEGEVLFSDDFNRVDPLSPWSVNTGSWQITDMTLRGTAGGQDDFAKIYYNPATPWTDYSVQARVQYPSGAYGGGLVGRLDPAAGTRYTAWIDPGNGDLFLIKWSNWNSYSFLASTGVPPVGNGWHTVRMDFSGSRIRVYWDDVLMIDADDTSSPHLSGGIGFDAYSYGGDYLIAADDVEVLGPAQYETNGSLISSAFDGGAGAVWYSIAWEANIPASTSICLRTRSAEQADLLAAADWSACYAPGSAEITSADLRWMQYQIELATSDSHATPVFYDNLITYNYSLTNQAPVAVDDSYATSEDTLLVVPAPGVLDNDSDPNGDELTAVRMSDPAHGTLTLNADGSFEYTPALNYHGTDSFTYVANDGALDSNLATVTITVSAVNNAPEAVDDAYTTDEDTDLTIALPGVLGNDSDPDGDPLTAIKMSDPTHGALIFNPDGSFSYTPAGNWSGTDSFSYVASDGELDSNLATVTITVEAVNDPPVAEDDGYAVYSGQLLQAAAPGVLGNDTDIDSPALTASLVTDVGHGVLALNPDGSFSYTSEAGYSGIDSFTYVANDGLADGDPATVTIEVIGDVLFKDGFESGDLSAWTTSVTDGGDLSVEAGAALVGSYGLQAVIDDNNGIFVQDDTPAAERRYRARFYFDPNSIGMAAGNSHYIFNAQSSTQGIIMLQLYYNGSNYLLRGAVRTDAGGWLYTVYTTLSDARHYIELDWQAASGPGLNDGSLTLWLDGVQASARSGVDNDLQRLESVQMGAVMSVDNGTRGTYYFDAFESRRVSYIGMGHVEADFTADQTQGSPPLTVSFTNLSLPLGPDTTYLWDFGDGNSSTEANPVHTYATGGSYTVSLTAAWNGLQDTETKSNYILVSEEIFKDGFESGDLSAWTASVTDGGDLSVEAGAALVGSYGLQAVIDDNNGMFVQDDTPAAERRYRARFYFDPSSIGMAAGNSHYIFNAQSGTAGIIMLQFYYDGSNYKLRGAVRTDAGGWLYTTYTTLSDARHYIELDWQAASGPGLNDGSLTLWLDGVQASARSGVDNDLQRLESVQLGAVMSLDNGTRGTHYFDAFESHRVSYIGPDSSEP